MVVKIDQLLTYQFPQKTNEYLVSAIIINYNSRSIEELFFFGER